MPLFAAADLDREARIALQRAAGVAAGEDIDEDGASEVWHMI